MRLVLYTSKSILTSELFLYIYAHVASQFQDVKLVAVVSSESLPQKLRRFIRKIRRLGVWSGLEILTSLPLKRSLAGRDQEKIKLMLSRLPRPRLAPDLRSIIFVPTVNGPEAVQAIGRLSPDIIIQAGAGILQSQIFTLADIGTLNIHHGIAPLIKGMDSIYWGLWERQSQWLGSTLHWIDAGIDTGGVLAYHFVAPRTPKEGFPELFVRATEGGVANLVQALRRLEQGERWVLPPMPDPSVYRSTFSGWKLLRLWLR
jgi:hypothetical protein